jgi:hypothetical protein
MNSSSMNLVAGIYFHPEAYPPTLNAIGELSECFDHISIVHRPHLKGNWRYPANVSAIATGKLISSMDQEKASFIKKMLFFLDFTRVFFLACKREKPVMILVYDNLSLLAYSMFRPFLHKHKIWYHNHDVTEIGLIRKYSISWFAARKELQAFNYLDIFSLPTDERLPYFPMNRFKGQYFYIPNFPSKKFYSSFYQLKELGEPIRMIFQGSIGPYHGIEEIIPFLNETINGYHLQLVLKGPCRDDYRLLCAELAKKYGVSEKLFFLGITPYSEVPVAGSKCDIGIGILARQDIMNTTLGTASNKLYEYAAIGLPVIYYNQNNFTKYLGKYSWAFAVNLNSEDIKEKIRFILNDYSQLSADAHNDFMKELNFEKGFSGIKHYIMTSVVKPSAN